jgi:uncharacterized protein YdaU (DUF1376 family)
MSDSPYFCFFPSDYIAATVHLGWYEDLAYRRLLDRYYLNRAPIPNDRALIMRLVRASEPEQQAAVDVVLAEFFELKADGWHQKKADQELAYLLQKSKSARDAANSRWNKIKELDDANAMRTQCDGNAPTPHPTHTSTSLTPNPKSSLIGSSDLNTVLTLPDVKKRTSGGQRATRLPKDWRLPKSWGVWALQENPALTETSVRKIADEFRDYWIAKSGPNATKLDWEATWRNWIRKIDKPVNGKKHEPPWWSSDKTIEAKARGLGMWPARGGETMQQFKARIEEKLNEPE